MIVWIVNPYDNLPLEGYRPQRYWLMARAFAQSGHDVTFWTSDFSHAHKRPRELTGEIKGDGFELRMIPTPPYPKNICLKRILSHRAFAKRWFAMAKQECPPDILVVSMPPISLGAVSARFCLGKKTMFIVDIQDAWPETFARVLPDFTLFPLKRLAGRIYRSANAISGVAHLYLKLAASYGSNAPMHFTPHGIQRIEEGRTTAMQGSKDKRLHLAYAGNMGKSYDISTVIDAVRADDSLCLDLAGTGPNEAKLRNRAADCPRIKFHGYISASALRDILASSDAGIIPMFDDSCVGLPGKLADYAAAELPMLNSLSGETAQLIDEYHAGFNYASGSVESLNDAVGKLRSANHIVLSAGAKELAKLFDADIIYPAYVRWAESIYHSTTMRKPTS